MNKSETGNRRCLFKITSEFMECLKTLFECFIFNWNGNIHNSCMPIALLCSLSSIHKFRMKLYTTKLLFSPQHNITSCRDMCDRWKKVLDFVFCGKAWTCQSVNYLEIPLWCDMLNPFRPLSLVCMPAHRSEKFHESHTPSSAPNRSNGNFIEKRVSLTTLCWMRRKFKLPNENERMEKKI